MTELVPPELLDHMRGHVTPQAGEDVSDFDDLDDDELSNYIANAKEVINNKAKIKLCVGVGVCVFHSVCLSSPTICTGG